MAKKQQELKALTADVKDLINQILIKLESIPAHEVQFDDEYYPMSNKYSEGVDCYGNPVEKKSDQELFLGCVKDYLTTAIKDTDGTDVEYLARRYHTSSCF